MLPKHKPKQLEFIQQKYKSDCGVACIAMLTNKIYEEVATICKILKKSYKKGLCPADVLDILEELDFSYKELNDIPKRGNALIAVQWKDPNLSGHFVVWNSKRKQVLDPLNGLYTKTALKKSAYIEGIWRIL